VIGGKVGADRAIAVFLLDVGRAANELAGSIVIDEQGRIALNSGICGISARLTTPSFSVILASLKFSAKASASVRKLISMSRCARSPNSDVSER
jgi:hypothetical protein